MAHRPGQSWVHLILLVFLAWGIAPRLRAEDLTASTVARMAADLQYLASDELAGRDVGSEGIAKAGEFIAQRFADLGLQTDSFDGKPFQVFTIPGLAELGPTDQNRLQVTGLDKTPEWKLGENFTPVSLGSDGQFEGELVFAGYGITAPELNYDDYENVDVEGKVVVVLRKQPRQNNPSSKFGERSSQYAYFSTKELNAALHKAAALIIVNDSATVKADGEDILPAYDRTGSAVSDMQVPTFYALRSTIDSLLQQSLGTNLAELEATIEEAEQPKSAVLPGVIVSGEAKFELSPVRNVIGFLPGAGLLADQFVVVGAHYDHVGMGGMGSLAPGTIEVHNGADDNASGTTALLEVARRMAAKPAADRRGIVFIAFTGEERGLLGSAHYVRNPRWPLENTIAMVNMDMVGRLSENRLTVYGTGTATGFDTLIDRFNEITGFDFEKVAAGFGPSDHASFYEVDIPVYHFFTGLHNDYHRPSDDFEKANLDGMARIATLVANVVNELSTMSERPQLIKRSEVAQINRGPRRSPRAVLGIQLDMTTELARIDSVTQGSPAEKAGLLTGDTIVSIDGDKVASIAELRRILASRKPEETATIVVQRGSEVIEVQLTFAAG